MESTNQIIRIYVHIYMQLTELYLHINHFVYIRTVPITLRTTKGYGGKKYIAAQAPMKHTEDIWKVIANNKCPTIIVLANFVEAEEVSERIHSCL